MKMDLLHPVTLTLPIYRAKCVVIAALVWLLILYAFAASRPSEAAVQYAAAPEQAPQWQLSANRTQTDARLGNGRIVEELRHLDAFDHLQIRVTMSVVIEYGDHASIRLKGDSNLLPIIRTEIEDTEHGRALVIKTDTSYSTKKMLSAVLVLPSRGQYLRSVSATGAARVNFPSMQASELRLCGQGASQFNLGGAVSTIRVDVDGAVDVSAHQLKAKRAFVWARDAAKVSIEVIDFAEVHVQGAANADILGKPGRVDYQAQDAANMNLDNGVLKMKKPLNTSVMSSESFLCAP